MAIEVDKKYQDYNKRIREIEQENETMSAQLAKARHHIKRLRIERIVLLEEIDSLRRSSTGRKYLELESDSEMSISESIQSEVKSRKVAANPAPKKKRDPNAPKGPGNVFFLYCRMERDNIKDESPNESLGEVTRLLGQKWKALTKDEKQKYYDIYKKEQEEYESAMKSYNAANGIVVPKMDDEEEIDMLQEDDVDQLV